MTAGFIASMEATLEDLRNKLPIAYVLEQYGHLPSGETYGRLHYVNPWRDDENPSLDLFINDKGEQRAGDFADGFQGSVIDVIQKLDEFTTREAVVRARNLYANFLDSTWEGPTIKGREQEEDGAAQDRFIRVSESGNPKLSASELVNDLLQSKTALTLSALDGWGLTWDEKHGSLYIPYESFNALRIRHMDGTKTFGKGSKPGLYFKNWDDSLPVLLVEGESDTWAATAMAPGFHVVGIPGVGSNPDKLGMRLAGREVVIFFDGDKAGRQGAEVWAEWLGAHGSNATIVPTPEGKDICDLTLKEFRFLLTQRSMVVRNTGTLRNLTDGYGYESNQENKYISNWVFYVTRRIKLPDGATAYEGDFALSGRVTARSVVLDLNGMGHSDIHEWAGGHGGSWVGSKEDHRRLAMLLASESYSLPVIPGTNKPGLHMSTFVWPFGNVGPSEVLPFEDPNQSSSLAEFYDIPVVRAHDAMLTMTGLLATYDWEVLCPLLSWLAIAPLRDLYSQFPIMFITGQSGSGKTTLTKAVLTKFSGTTLDTSLSGTPHSVLAILSGTNAFPVWFDEYRQGSRKDTMATLNQLMRDAYTKSASGRGGMDRNSMSKIMRYTASAPMLITGEDYADEQSHRDRLIKLFLPQDGKRTPVEGWLKPVTWNYFAWLTGHNKNNRVYTNEPPAITPSKIKGLSDRMAYNIGVLDAGYSMLSDYCLSLGIIIKQKDWTNIIKQMIEDEEGDAVLDVIRAAGELKDGEYSVWYGEDCTYVHSSSLYTLVARNPGLGVLPWTSGHTATKALIKQYNGKSVTVIHPQTMIRTRVVKLPFVAGA